MASDRHIAMKTAQAQEDTARELAQLREGLANQARIINDMLFSLNNFVTNFTVEGLAKALDAESAKRAKGK